MAGPGLRLRVLALALFLAAVLPGAAAPARAQAFPQLAGRQNALRAPGPQSSPRLPLGLSPASDYGRLLHDRHEGTDSLAAPAFVSVLGFWRNGLSPLEGGRSDLAPVTSLYSVQAFRRHGVVLGFVLTAERLLHEPDVVGRVPWFEEGGRRFYVDSLRDNTWWLPDWLR